MGYDWPFASDPVLDEALKIALDYLRDAGQSELDDDRVEVVACAILAEWLAGTRHPIRLANAGIIAGQQDQSPKPTGALHFLRKRFFDC
jgi:hypothetical protein